MSSETKSSVKWIMGGVYFFFFLLAAPLGNFNDWIPPIIHKGYYSVTTIDPGDDAGYYAYLRSGFFDGDWDFVNERGYFHFDKFLETGYAFNNWQIGQSILHLPFFLAGHAVAKIYSALGYPISTDGYSQPYYMATALASQTYVFLGLAILFCFLRKHFEDKIALITTLSIFCATFLPYFTFARQRMAHSSEFFVAIIFCWVWIEKRISQKFSHHALMGAILGALCMIRVINVAYIILYATDQLLQFITARSKKESVDPALLIRNFFGAAGFFLIVFSPQNVAWWRLDGFPLPSYHSEMAERQGTQISMGTILNHLADFLIGKRWGILFSTPILILASFGIIKGSNWMERFKVSFLLYIGAMVVIILFLYSCCIVSYEYRFLTPALPVFAIGLASSLKRAQQKPTLYRLFLFLIVLFIIERYALLIQYKTGLDYNHPEFSLQALVNLPFLIIENPERLLRSSNWFQLIVLHQKGWDYLDTMFLILFPLTQLTLISVILMYTPTIANNIEARLNHHKVLSGLIILSGLFNSYITWATPDKTQKEINNRMEYQRQMKIGEILKVNGQLQQAETAFLKAFKSLPESWRPPFQLAWIKKFQRKGEEAIPIYLEILKTHAYHEDTLLNLASLLCNRGNLDQAKEYIDRYFKIVAVNPNAYNIYGEILLEKGKFEEAKTAFKNAIQLNPVLGSGRPHSNLAYLMMQSGEADEARRLMRRARELGFDD